MIKLILKSKDFVIPSDFCYFNDVKPEIYQILTTKEQYEVQSNVSEEVFQSFLDYWTTKKLPKIDDNNLSEFIELSEEFNLMTDIIQMYQQFSSKISKIEKKLEEKKNNFSQEEKKYNEIVTILFNIPEIQQTFYHDYTESRSAFEMKDIEYIELLTKEKVEKDGILYVINSDDFTCGVIGYDSEKVEDVFIPKSIQYKSNEYTVTVLYKKSFYHLKCPIQFSEDSEIEIIEDESFLLSGINEIKIPKKVRRIGKSAFMKCYNLEKVTFSENSELEIIDEKAFFDCCLNCISIPQTVKQIGDRAFNCKIEKIEISSNSKLEKIGKFAFEDSLIEKFTITSCVSQIGEGSFKGTKSLKNIEVMKENRHFSSINNNNYVVCKSSSKSDNFDVLFFVNRDLEEAHIPDNIKRIESYSFNLCNNIQKVTFTKNSTLDTFCEYSFFESGVVSIQIPPRVTNIDKKCFIKADKLVNIEVMKENLHFSSINENNYVVCKSSPKSDNFDVLFFVNRDLEEAHIPDNIKRIESYSFNLCNNLQKVTFSENSTLDTFCEYSFFESGVVSIQIPKTVRTICKHSFSNCDKLKDVTFLYNSELQTIEKYAFSPSSLRTIKIPPSVTSIGKYCFKDCTNLVEVLIPENSKLETIGKNAFSDTSIVSITIPKHVSIIKDDAFSDCQMLTKIEFAADSNLKIIEKGAFSGCSFEKVEIPIHVIKIGAGCFQTNPNLKEVIFPENSELVILEDCCFSETIIETITIPPKVKKLGTLSYTIKTVNFSENSELTIIEDNCFLYSTLEKIGPIPSTVTTIGEQCFHCCHDLETIEFCENSQLHTIGKNAFDTTGIKSIVIPRHVTRIMKETFYNCEQLESVKFEEGSELKTIEDDAFECSSIKHLQIPSNVTELQNRWLSDTPELVDIQISPENKTFSVFDDQIILKKSSVNGPFDVIAFAIRTIETIMIPSFIKIIGSDAFSSCKNLETVEFEKDSNLELISDNSLSKTGIEHIEIPASVTEIGNNAFSQCDNLQKIEFDDNSKLVSIGEDALAQSSIESLSIPSSIEYFGLGWCFLTTKLNNITILPADKQNICYFDNQFILGKIDLDQPNFNTIIFVRRDVQEVKIPHFIEQIDPYAIHGCLSLNSVEFEKNSQLKVIGYKAFSHSKLIKDVEIPSSVEIIENCAFQFCDELRCVSFSQDSRLKEISLDSISSLCIPPHTIKISVFYIQIIYIDENTELNQIYLNDFKGVEYLMIPSRLKIL